MSVWYFPGNASRNVQQVSRWLFRFVLVVSKVCWISDVIQVLSESPKVCHEHQHSSSKLRVLCLNNSLSSNPTIAAQAVSVLTQILCYRYYVCTCSCRFKCSICTEASACFVCACINLKLTKNAVCVVAVTLKT